MNQVLSTVFQLITMVLVFYFIALMLRILSSWFVSSRKPAWLEVLAKFTDPYLDLFRRIGFLRFRSFDLSPVLALGLVYIAFTISYSISLEHRVWFGLVVALFIQVIGSSISFLFVIFAVLAAIRLIAILARASSVQQVWFLLDHLLQPMVYPIISRLSPRKVLPYGTGLGIFIAINILLYILSSNLFYFLAILAHDAIPF